MEYRKTFWIALLLVAVITTPTLAQSPSASVGGNCTKIGLLSGSIATPLVCQNVGNGMKWVLAPGGNCSKAGTLAGTVTKPWVCQKVSGRLKWVVANNPTASTAPTTTTTTTTTTSATTTTIAKQVCVSAGVCSVGDTGPGGGIVFYDAGSPQTWGRYLEIAPKDLAVRYEWNNAMNAALAYRGGGLSDWRLPTKEELNFIYIKRVIIGGFSRVDYWSSTEYSATQAWAQFFGGGSQFYCRKECAHYINIVRAF